MADDRDPSVERMASLTFALLGATQSGGNPFRSAEWIQANVPGYTQNDEGKDGAGAFRKMLKRDVIMLREAGVPVIYRPGKGDEPTYVSIDEDSYRLPEVTFTPDEAVVLGLAGGLGQKGGLSEFSKTGWTKIAAAGSTRTGAPQFSTANDVIRMDAGDFRALIDALSSARRVTFDYRAMPTAEAQRRAMDPWGLVPRGGRVYIVGWDLDRQAPRSFRITRVASVQATRATPADHHPRPADTELDAVVDQLVEPRDLIDARVRIPAGEAWELEDAGERGGDGIVELRGVSAEWLARTAVGYAPDVEVLEPAAVRDRILELLGGDHDR